MRIRISNKFWRLRFASKMANRDDCDPPDQRNKEIRVSSSLRGEERLEVPIHELVHSAGWHIDEQFVERFAREAARALGRLGRRYSVHNRPILPSPLV